MPSGSLGPLVDRVARAAEPIVALRAAASSHDLGPETLMALTDEVPRRGRSNLREAERLARASVWLARRLNDLEGRARAIRAAGHVDNLALRHRTALRRYDEAAALFQAAGKELEAAVTMSGSLQPLIYCGEYAPAFARAARAREVFRRHRDRARLARLDSNEGNVYFRQDRFAEALSAYRRAVARLRTAGSPGDVAVALRNAAVCLISLGRFDEALATYAEARAHADRHGMPLLAAEADYNVGYLYFHRGEYDRATSLYEAARRFCINVGDRYHAALCDLDEAELRLELNDIASADALARSAATRFARLRMRYELAKALAFRGVAASRAGDRRQGDALFRRARATFAAEGNRIWPALIDLYRAAAQARTADAGAVRRLARRASAIFVREGVHAKAAACDLLLARLDLDARRFRRARQLCDRAEAHVAAAGEVPAISWQVSAIRGAIAEALGERDAATAAYLDARHRMETLRSHLQRDELKVAFLVDKLAVYEALVALAADEGRNAHTAALEYIEEAKSRALADLVARGPSPLPPRSAGSAAAAHRVDASRRTLAAWVRQIEHEETAPTAGGSRLARLRHLAADTEKVLGRRLAELAAVDGEMAALHTGGIARIDEIRAALPADTLIVDYYVARETVYAGVIGRDTLQLRPLAAAADVRTTVRLLRFQMAKFALGPRYVRAFADVLSAAADTHLRTLYDRLIAPIAAELGDRRLIIVPHDVLHRVPFHAFHDGRGYLADRQAVSYAPSASVYYRCAIRRTTAEPRSLVLGVGDALAPRIPSEVRQVADALPNATILVGRDATVERLRDEGRHASRIHIATHAVFRADAPMLSSIRLGNRELTVGELYDLRLSCDLLTLSGCGTGLGVVAGGDELIGLTRALLYTGARALLVSLWDVNDDSTAAFMTEFYRRLERSGDKPLALAEAMRTVRTERPHPYYWAPFVLVGAEKTLPPILPSRFPALTNQRG